MLIFNLKGASPLFGTFILEFKAKKRNPKCFLSNPLLAKYLDDLQLKDGFLDKIVQFL